MKGERWRGRHGAVVAFEFAGYWYICTHEEGQDSSVVRMSSEIEALTRFNETVARISGGRQPNVMRRRMSQRLEGCRAHADHCATGLDHWKEVVRRVEQGEPLDEGMFIPTWTTPQEYADSFAGHYERACTQLAELEREAALWQ
jgi:hypothetical protein